MAELSHACILALWESQHPTEKDWRVAANITDELRETFPELDGWSWVHIWRDPVGTLYHEVD